MRRRTWWVGFAIILALLAFGWPEDAKAARAGGGRSFGSTGSRTFSAPSRTYTPPSRPLAPAAQPPAQPRPGPTATAPASSPMGGFWRALAGGVLGGFLGSLLFRGMAGAGGWGSGFGGGFGLLELLLLGGLAYGVYRMIKRGRAQEATATGYYERGAAGPYAEPALGTLQEPRPDEDLERGLQHIRQMDPAFEPKVFTEWATDAFFQIQAAWMRRDLSRLQPLLTEEMAGEFRTLIDESRAAGRLNKLENITVRSVEPVSAWQEQGKDYLTVRYLASLLDYTVDERTGAVVQGDDSAPVKFEEYWTWVRPVGPNPWRLSAIQQAA
ncbi:MAG: Tim44 domain-containing protein [Candidatus Methylomirabilales bacterium]